MAMVFEYDLAEGIAQLSYFIGDSGVGKAAVIDPRPDCGLYLSWAQKHGVAITHIFETHNHADFMSGARRLSECTGAPIYLAPEPDQRYGFDHQVVCDGEAFTWGATILTVRNTPGHTAAHIALEASEKGKEQTPWGIFTGDSLFVGSAGRPDLSGQTDALSEKLYDTLYNYFLKLDDGVIIYPCHGKGSACGPGIGDRLQSTIGYERRNNPFLQFDSRKDFGDYVASTAPPEPAHYARLKALNAEGPPLTNPLQPPPGFAPVDFQKYAKSGNCIVVDTRSIFSFGGAHIAGAINIAARPELSIYAAWVLDPEASILLVLENDLDLHNVLELLHRTGVMRIEGYLAGGMKAWANASEPMVSLEQITVHDVRNEGPYGQILDVRTQEEWTKGHIPGATHFFLPDLRSDLPDIEPSTPVATYCGSGYRASIAASILQARGYKTVRNIPGSWTAWQKAGYPEEKGK